MKPFFKEGYTFKDFLLQPQHFDGLSRSECSVKPFDLPWDMDIPIFSANMDSVTGYKMCYAMKQKGGMGVMHRYWNWDEDSPPGTSCIPSVGVGEAGVKTCEILQFDGYESVCIDIAHGDSKQMIDFIHRIKPMFKNIIAGNVASAIGARRLFDAGVNVVKVGIGPGKNCATRHVTGHGMPQLSAIWECAPVAKEYRGAIIADGGLSSSGDIVKALAAGANAVMLGSMLARTRESLAATVGSYRGMASKEAQLQQRGYVGNGQAEGSSTKLDHPSNWPSVETVIDSIVAGIRSGLSYSGVKDIKALQREAIWVKVSPGSYEENNFTGVL
jgi:IMP dehydrogenase